MNRRLAVAVAGAAVAIAVGSVGPAAAFAGLPSTQKGSLIVPGVSIGAVKLGVRKAKLLTAWGPGGDCSPNATEGDASTAIRPGRISATPSSRPTTPRSTR